MSPERGDSETLPGQLSQGSASTKQKPDPSPSPVQTSGDIRDKLLTSAGHKDSSGNAALPFLSSTLNATLKNLSLKSHCHLLISLEGHSTETEETFLSTFQRLSNLTHSL